MPHHTTEETEQVFCTKDVLKNFTKVTGKRVYQSIFLIKLQAALS